MVNIENAKSLDVLLASGYAWGELLDGPECSPVAGDGEFEQRVQFLKILTMCALFPR